jgi:hypothetical protein
MKKLLVLLFSILISSSSYAEWKYVTTGTSGNDYYIDYQSIKKNNGYYYYYALTDLLEPDKDGDLSYSAYRKVDCKVFRTFSLSEFYYSKNMGKGKLTNNPNKNPEWRYPAPGSMTQRMISELCDYVK